MLRFYRCVVPSTQLQGRERKERKDKRRDPKAGDDLGLRPAQQLKMMVQRRHLEDPFLAQLVGAHLQHHGKRFNYKDAANKGQQ